ncbi:MAG: CvpA family protein [Proteobacteria bacterium]|nr:CvpA family protein [Pseudomonadota bacterium]
MTIVDFVIIVAVLASVVVGVIRGIVREAIAIAALLIAIWAALHLGPYAGGWLGGSMGSSELELWAGRFLVFIFILAIGGLTGWGVSKIVRMAGLSGTDRYLGGLFGMLRAVVLIGLFVLLGRYAAFDAETWWLESELIPYAETVADWIDVMAPKGLEILQPDEMIDDFQFGVPDFT